MSRSILDALGIEKSDETRREVLLKAYAFISFRHWFPNRYTWEEMNDAEFLKLVRNSAISDIRDEEHLTLSAKDRDVIEDEVIGLITDYERGRLSEREIYKSDTADEIIRNLHRKIK